MEDKKIIDLYFQRDESAIAETKAKYEKYCFGVANGILSSPSDAEECVSDTFLRAWNAIPPEKPRQLKLFLGRITRNLSVDRLRTNTAQKRGNGETQLALDELSGCISAGGDPADTLEFQQLQQAIARFLHTLPQREKDLFLCRYFYVESYRKLAKRFHIREENARLILSRVRGKLRDFLTEEGFDV